MIDKQQAPSLYIYNEGACLQFWKDTSNLSASKVYFFKRFLKFGRYDGMESDEAEPDLRKVLSPIGARHDVELR